MTTSTLSDDELLRRPIIVLGAPRSGTSLLISTLRRHPALGTLSEPRVVWRYGNDRKSDMLRAEDARPKVKRHIRKKFASMVRELGGTRLAEKTPSNSLRPAFVDAIFPDAIFIHIIRNGVDSVMGIQRFFDASAKGIAPAGDSGPAPRAGRLRARFGQAAPSQLPYYAMELARRVAPRWMDPVIGPALTGPRLPGMAQMWTELDRTDMSCLQWRMCVETACQFGRRLPAGRYMEVRLEDLTPDKIVEILEFGGLEAEPAVTDYFNGRYDPNRPQARRKVTDEDEHRRILDWIEPTMTWLGDTF